MNPNLKRPAVLIVDSQWESTFLLQRLIRSTKTDHPVHTANGAQPAVELLRLCVTHGNPKPFLILLDIGTPPDSGFEVLQWLHRHQEFKDVTVVMLASAEDPSDRRKALELGAQGYLLKYPATQTLAEIIAQAAPPEHLFRNSPEFQSGPDRSAESRDVSGIMAE